MYIVCFGTLDFFGAPSIFVKIHVIIFKALKFWDILKFSVSIRISIKNTYKLVQFYAVYLLDWSVEKDTYIIVA